MLRTLQTLSSTSFRRRALLGVVGVLMGAASACANISLSSGAGFGAVGTVNPASTEDGGSSGGGSDLGTEEDGGPVSSPVPTLVGNPLCSLRTTGGDAGSLVCDPDNVIDGGGLQCNVPDAGDTRLPDGGVGAAGGDDGGAGGDGSSGGSGNVAPVSASPETTGPACHIAAPDAGELQVCTAAGTGTDGTECRASTDCANGYECVGSPGQCRHYCCAGNAVCDVTYLPSFCNPEPVVSGGFSVPVCIPISGCSLFGQCPAGQTCGVVTDDGTTSCVPIGPQGIGQECDTADCAAGLTCIGTVGSRVCYELCHVASTSECPAGTTCTGSAQLFQDPQFGICR
jgi:hypothetical protein